MLQNKGMNETTETIVYCLMGLLIAVSLNRGLAVALDTSLPVVTVSSESMVPTLNVGDIAVIYGREEYKISDIIVFDGWEDEPIIHRIVGIVKKGGDGIQIEKSEKLSLTGAELKKYGKKYFDNENINKIYITKGDNNPTCDQCGRNIPPIIESNIHGKSIFMIPYLGWIKLFVFRYILFNPLGLIITSIIIIAFVLHKTL